MNAATSRPRHHARRPRTAGLLAALAALTLGLSACGGGGDGASSDASGTPGADDPIRVGVVGASEEHWKIFQQKAEEAGFDVEIVDFTEYTQPNPALSQGQLDLNQFQHILYLAQYNVEAGDDLVPVGATAIYPLGLYSKQYTSVDEIPDGAEVAIPNDPTNLARALLVLQDAGLVTLKDGGSAFSTEADVVADSSRVTVTPVDAQQTAIALDSVAASIVNNDFLTDAGIDPDSALYTDDADSEAAKPYINIWAAQAADAGNQRYLDLIAIYEDPEVQAALQAASGGTAVIADQTPAELQQILTDVEADAKNA